MTNSRINSGISRMGALLILLASIGISALLPQEALAQSNISGDIVGTVVDAAGAVVPNAQVTVTNTATGQVKTVTTGGRGDYRVPLLPPAQYKVSVIAPGFQTTTTDVTVTANSTTPGDIRLSVGQNTTTVQVTAEGSLFHTDSAEISTTFSLEEIQALPNPGNDLTFVAQTTPGAVMNTQSGYGNFSTFGLPATSNVFTVNGGYENDPFLNVNNSGATNLLLGNNDISDVTVTSNAYDASLGGLGGTQVNEISRSGGNKFHGNAAYWWNGRIMNANSWFNKHAPAGQQTPRSFDNVNQWAAAIGGPIYKDKSFFFADYEGLRVVIPTRGTVYAPSPAYQAATLAAIPSTEVALYNTIFGLYNNAPGFANATPVVHSDGTTSTTAVQFNGNAGNFTHEYLVSGRIDQILGQNDHLFGHFKIDKGIQATFTSLLNPVFNVASPQPQYEGQLNETRTFSPNLTNQFLFTASYYRAIFTNTNQAKANALVPFTLVFLGGDLGNNSVSGLVGGENYVFPQGRNVTGYQFSDDLSWSRGNHAIKLGWAMRRDDVTDYGPSIRFITPEAYATEGSFGSGYATRFRQTFPVRPTQPIAVYTMGGYIQDQWKLKPNLTVTAGLRVEHNSNPICVTNCFADLNQSFLPLAATTSTATPYNQQIRSGLHQALNNFQTAALEPRLGVAWLPDSKTTVRAGFGVFADAFPGQIAEEQFGNAPTSVPFYIRGKYLLDSSLPGSGAQTVANSNAAFRTGFANGASYDTLAAAGIGFTAPNVSVAYDKIHYPTYEEYSLSVERQIIRDTVLSVSYVGNHGYHEPLLNNGINSYGFGSLPATAPTSSFGQVSQIQSNASSNYNGAVVSLIRRTNFLTLKFNYTYSHALDQISNGGFNAFSGQNTATDPIASENPYNVAQNYGNADYDIRHYISGSYVINVPHYFGPRVLTEGWQVAGTVFHSTGLPFTIIDSGTPNNYGGSLYAQQLPGKFSHHCGGAQSVDNPCDLSNFFVPASDFGQQGRNQLTGSGYTDTDLDLSKSFKIPYWESASLKLGAQFFNLFNHPNFGQPLNDVESGFGTINATVNTPTSILGSFLGGDASPRLVQLKADFSF